MDHKAISKPSVFCGEGPGPACTRGWLGVTHDPAPYSKVDACAAECHCHTKHSTAPPRGSPPSHRARGARSPHWTLGREDEDEQLGPAVSLFHDHVFLSSFKDALTPRSHSSLFVFVLTRAVQFCSMFSVWFPVPAA